ncbi:cation diffusion facilitator family transporter [Candidatus Bathyarchaeota archaeon]|nr:cation diffusion facilitator family transporter [Candidatus Bathyarchaeota archaeon]
MPNPKMLESKNLQAMKTAERALLLTMAAYGTLVLVKAIVGFLLNSALLRADVVHDLVDVLSILSAFLAVRISRRTPSDKFPYGFFKFDNLVSLLLGAGFIIAAIFVIREAINKFSVPSEPGTAFIPFIISMVSTGVIFVISWYLVREGKRSNLNSLLVVGRDKFIDSFVGIAISVTFFLTWLDVNYIESIFMLVLGGLIITSALTSVKDSIMSLLDASMNDDDLEKIRIILAKDDRVTDTKDIRFRKAGPYYFGEVSIILPPSTTSKEITYITNDLQAKIRSQIKQVAHVNIIVEAREEKVHTIMVPLTGERKELNSVVSKHFGRAEFFGFVTVDDDTNTVLSQQYRKNDYRQKEVRAGLAIVREMVDKGVNIVITRNIGEISFIALQNQLVEIFSFPERDSSLEPTLQNVIDSFFAKGLKKLVKPTRSKD